MKLLRFLFNKYMLTLAGFIVLMLFFDQADWISQQERKRDLKDVNERIVYLQEEIDKMETQYAAIKKDPQALERFARENYRMKRDTEDLYIVERK